MLQLIRRHPRAFLLALGLHLLIVFFSVVSLHFTSAPRVPGAAPVVEAVAVDEREVAKEIEKLKADDRAREEKQQRETERLEQLEKQRKVEQQRLAELERKQRTETERLKKLETEKVALEKRKAEETKKLAEMEAKRKVEEKRKAEDAKKTAAEEAKKAAEAAKKKSDEASQKAREQALRDALAAEESASLVDRYVGIIKDRVERAWLRPPNARKGLSCTVLVKLMPGGDVALAKVVKSSGDPAFDESVERAVYKAAPLPLPTDQPALFEKFREMEFIFKPED